jgi:hypothetical protein
MTWRFRSEQTGGFIGIGTCRIRNDILEEMLATCGVEKILLRQLPHCYSGDSKDLAALPVTIDSRPELTLADIDADEETSLARVLLPCYFTERYDS